VTDPTPAPGDAALPWAYQPGRKVERVTDRKRAIVGNLPAWEPLPPGEIQVRRRREE
jgi:hypothetical protein